MDATLNILHQTQKASSLRGKKKITSNYEKGLAERAAKGAQDVSTDLEDPKRGLNKVVEEVTSRRAVRSNPAGQSMDESGPSGEANFANLMARILDLFQRQEERHEEQMRELLKIQQTPQPQGDVVERFYRLNPPIFNGAANPMGAERWIKSLDMIFDHMKLGDEERVLCLVFKLDGKACHWWESIKITHDVRNMKWDQFKEIFFDRYFPKEVRAKKIQEFLELRQGNMSVVEYVEKFEEGSRYATCISEKEELIKQHFLRGLNPGVRLVMRTAAASSYSKMVAMALSIDEKEIDEEFIQTGQGMSSFRQYRGAIQRPAGDPNPRPLKKQWPNPLVAVPAPALTGPQP